MTQAIEALITNVDQYLPKYITGLNYVPKNAQGFELELETKNPVIFPVNNSWFSKKEGSLRNFGTELILRKPLAGGDLIKALENIAEAIQSVELHLVDTIRTSTHVHHNVQDKSGLDLLSIFGVYWIVEDLMMDYCGKWRKGNYNCLTMSATNSLHGSWSRHLREFTDDPRLKKNYQMRNTIYSSCNESYRYSSLNPAAVRQFGSVEFRGMRSIIIAAELKQWSNMIQKLIDFQEEHGTIDKILKRFKNATPREIVSDIFGPYISTLMVSACPQWEDELSENLMKVVHFSNSLFTWDKIALTEYYKEAVKAFEENQNHDPYGINKIAKVGVVGHVNNRVVEDDPVLFNQPPQWNDPFEGMEAFVKPPPKPKKAPEGPKQGPKLAFHIDDDMAARINKWRALEAQKQQERMMVGVKPPKKPPQDPPIF